MTTQSQGPLTGVRIVDLTQFVLGPYATQTLGDLGADVIKVEEPTGDRQRRGGGKAPNSPDMGPVFVALNRNKRSIALDLKTEDDRAKLRQLIRDADIFIHNMRPSSIEKLGFNYANVEKVKSDIIYVEAMGYDPEGPYAGRQAFDDLIQSASGATGLNTLVDPSQPLRPLPSIVADKTCGLFAVIATMAALRHKEQTGEGQYVCVPMLETFTGFIMAEHIYGETFKPATGRFGMSTTITPNRKPFKTKDGYLSVLPASREQSSNFMKLGGIPDAYESERFVSQPDNASRITEYYKMMEEAAASKTTAEWLDLCAEYSIPAMRANRPEEIFDDPQLKETLFEDREIAGEGTYRAMKPGLRFDKTPSAIRLDPPQIGEHTDEILSEIGAVAADES